MAVDKKRKIGDSQFNMIRCVLAVAHADGIIQEVERSYIDKITSRLDLTDEQHKTLSNDFEEQQDILELFDKIEDPQYKSQVIYFGRLMAWRDGELDPGEEDILIKLQRHASEKSAGFDSAEDSFAAFIRQNPNAPRTDESYDMPEDKNTSVVKHFFDKLFGR